MIKTIWLFSLFLLHTNFLSTSIPMSDFFKKPINKTKNHSMDEVDFIYMINLDQRSEKFESCIKQLAPYNINPYRFSAVNGWELSLETINKLGVKYDQTMRKNLWGTSYLINGEGNPHHEIMQVEGRNYFCHCMARGPIGIVLSHLSVLHDAYKSGYQRVWVMEDDIQIIKNPHEISTLIKKLDTIVGKDNWDILFTDRDTKDSKGNYVECRSYAPRPNYTPSNPTRFSTRTEISPEFTQIGARYGTYSMIVQRPAMKKILDFFDEYKIFLPYDMEFYFPNDIKIYAVTEDVVSTQPDALSDNGAPRYKEKQQLEVRMPLIKTNEYLKKITDKSNNHSIPGIDFIYMINLDKEYEKFENCIKQLSPYNINPYRFSAIDESHLSREIINNLGVKYQSSMRKNLQGIKYSLNNQKPLFEKIKTEGECYFHPNMTPKIISNLLNHLSILHDAYTSNYQTIWIMEDHIQVDVDPCIISSLIETLNNLTNTDPWDILFTDKDMKNNSGTHIPCFSYTPRPDFTPSDEKRFNKRIKINEPFIKIGARYGTYSMIINRSGIKKILDFFNAHQLFMPFDMEIFLPDNIKAYSLTYDIVSNQV